MFWVDPDLDQSTKFPELVESVRFAFTEISEMALRINPLPEDVDPMFASTEMFPLDSTVVEKVCIWFCKSVFKMFAVPSVEDSKLPFTNTPVVDPEEVMFTVDAV